MNDLKNWAEVTKGLYRYVISAGACYEIHILFWDHETDILAAKASLYIVGDWISSDRTSFERECLISNQPVFECLAAAVIDDEENNSSDTMTGTNNVNE